MSILLVTGIEGAQNCADVIAKQLATDIEIAAGRKAALALLRQKEFAAVVVDEAIAECDPAAAEAIWERAGLAIPLQVNFALPGAACLIREIRAALHRREREQMLARKAAAAAIRVRVEVHGRRPSAAVGTCALRCGWGSPVTARLRIVADLAGNLRRKLAAPSEAQI